MPLNGTHEALIVAYDPATGRGEVLLGLGGQFSFHTTSYQSLPPTRFPEVGTAVNVHFQDGRLISIHERRPNWVKEILDDNTRTVAAWPVYMQRIAGVTTKGNNTMNEQEVKLGTNKNKIENVTCKVVWNHEAAKSCFDIAISAFPSPDLDPPMIYIAHPVGASTPDGVAENLARAKRWLGYLMKHFGGVTTLVMSWAPLVEACGAENEKQNRENGMRMNFKVLDACKSIWMVGGRISPGMATEAAYVRDMRRPVFDFTFLGDEPPIEV